MASRWLARNLFLLFSIIGAQRGADNMPVKNHIVIVALAKICDPIMRPSAAEEYPELHESEFHIDGTTGDLLHNGDNMAADKFIEGLRKTRPQYFPDVVADNLQRDALAGNVTAHGRLSRQLGDVQYAEWCKANGAAPGKAATVEKTNETGHKSKSTNPWSADGWDFLRQQSITKSLGAAKAAELAAAAGSFVGATRPGARQLTPR
jgi:hypothetical protein